MNLLSECRIELLAYRLDLISHADLIAWADSRILSLEEPPHFLVHIATGEVPVKPEILDTFRNEPTDVETRALTKRFIDSWLLGWISLDQFAAHCYSFSTNTTGPTSETLHWISDEIHLCNIGVKDLEISMPSIKLATEDLLQRHS